MATCGSASRGNVHVVAAAQSATTVASGLQDRTASTFYLAAVLAVVAGAVLTGLLVLRLLAAPPRAGAVIGLSPVALLFGSWLAELMMGLGTGSDGLALSWLNVVVRWVPAVLVGAAIAWGGLGTRGRVLAAAVSLLLLWIVPAAITAVTSAAGSRVLLPYPSEMLGYALEVLRAAMSTPGLVLPPVLTAAVVAAAGIVLRGLLEQRLRTWVLLLRTPRPGRARIGMPVRVIEPDGDGGREACWTERARSATGSVSPAHGYGWLCCWRSSFRCFWLAAAPRQPPTGRRRSWLKARTRPTSERWRSEQRTRQAVTKPLLTASATPSPGGIRRWWSRRPARRSASMS